MKVALVCLALLFAIALAQDVDPEKDIREPEYDSDVAFYSSPVGSTNDDNRSHNSPVMRGPSSRRTRRPRSTRKPRTTRGPGEKNDWKKWIPSDAKNSFDWKSYVSSGSSQETSYDWRSYVPSKYHKFLKSFDRSSDLSSNVDSSDSSFVGSGADWRSYIPSQYRSFVKSYDYSDLGSGSGGQDNWHSYIPSDYRSYVKSFDNSNFESGSGGQDNWHSYIPSDYRSYVKSFDYSNFESGSGGQDNWHSYIPSDYRSYVSFDYSSYLPSKEGSGQGSFVSSGSESSETGSVRSFEDSWHSYVPSEHRSYLKSFDNSDWQSFVPSSYRNKFESA